MSFRSVNALSNPEAQRGETFTWISRVQLLKKNAGFASHVQRSVALSSSRRARKQILLPENSSRFPWWWACEQLCIFSYLRGLVWFPCPAGIPRPGSRVGHWWRGKLPDSGGWDLPFCLSQHARVQTRNADTEHCNTHANTHQLFHSPALSGQVTLTSKDQEFKASVLKPPSCTEKQWMR